MRLKRLLIGALFVVAGCVAWLPAQSAQAGTTCGNNLVYSQVGYTGYVVLPGTWARTPEGVSAYLTVRNAFVCNNDPGSFSTAWVMMQDNGVNDHYAQAGYMWDPQMGCMRDYTEWNIGAFTAWNPNGMHRDLGQCRAAGSRLGAYVMYVGAPGPYPSSTGYMDLLAGNLETTAFFDPWKQHWSFTPYYAGEVDHAEANDIPGSTSGYGDIYSMGIQSVATGKLVKTPCYLRQVEQYTVPNPNRYFSRAWACDHIAVYTNPVNR